MIDWRVRVLPATASTNDDVKQAAEWGEAEGLVIQALSQTAGRGRHGRLWQSPAGNLYCSALLRPPRLEAVAGFYSFAAALALADTVAHFAPQAAVSLKWPNDVLANGNKISGILLERAGDALVIGMGLNVAQQPEESAYPATSLLALGTEVELKETLNRLLERLAYWDVLLRRDGFDPIRAAWLARAVTGALTVKLPAGAISGDFAGLTDPGHLRLRLADGTERSIATGDVFPALAGQG